MNKNPLVTVGLPTFNRKNLLERALNSVLNQTYKNIDILVSDNHSDDGTEEIMLEYAKKDSRIRYFRQEKNQGVGYQGKFLLENSLGEYYCGLCDDDYLSENYVKNCVNILIENPEISVTYGTVNLIDENNNIIKKCPTFKTLSEDFNERIKDYVSTGIDAFFASVFIKTDLCKIITSDYEKNRFCEDQLFVLKSLIYGKSVCSEKAIFYKLNNGCTKDLETLKHTFNLESMTTENFWYYLSKEYMNSILNDGIYVDKFSFDERLDFAITAYEAVKTKFKIDYLPKKKSLGQKFIDKIRGKNNDKLSKKNI